MALVFLLPLIAYGIAALSTLALRVGGPKVSYGAGRMALFWAMLATAPLMLVYGAVAGLTGPGPLASSLGMVVFLAFLWLWMMLLRTAKEEAASWT